MSSYIVLLEPQSTGQVRITIEQRWKVLSGDIPWITVGLPNSSFSVESFGGAASKVMADSSSGFSGVRIDLDKDYKPGQTFDIKFTVLQGNLLERLTADQKWRIDYTPGWYDRATIDHLQINLVSPVDYQAYTSVRPVPASTNNNVITWDQSNLGPGGRFNVVVECTDGSFLSASAASASQGNGLGAGFFIAVAVVLLFGFLIFWAIRRNRQARDAEMSKRVAVIEAEMAEDKKKKDDIEAGFGKYVEKKQLQPDTQGRYYDRSYGNYITPAIWAATISNQYNRQQPPPGSGSRAGCVSCACVSCACACACACAGGGAAGCSRKSLHECQTCSFVKGKADPLKPPDV
ncbi:MAG: hypothetical protein PHU08_07335 [Dehalococcoidales bacterium]|nr:hypothetical protein [Dehalococcoidales bacterium]